MSAAADEADRQQRAGADPGANVFVTANAGSGKTKVLIDRIARLLLAEGAEPSAFLCVTYTKAAAAEMQRRLFERLGAWAVATDADLAKGLADLLGETGPMPADRLARARTLFARALETPGGLKIQTIHAFCERLLARFPLEAGVPPGFAIADDVTDRALREQVLAEAALAAEGPEAAALARFAAILDEERLESLARGLLASRAKLEAVIAAAGGLAAAQAEIRARHGDPPEREAIVRALVDDAPWDALLRAADQLAAEGKKAQELAEHVHAAFASRDPEHYLAVFHTQKGEPRQSPVPKKLAAAQPWIADLFSPAGELGRAARLAQTLKAADRVEDTLAALVLGEGLARRHNDAKRRAGALDFEDLILAARALLERSAAAAWVLYKLDGGLDHILIDEGQDTSPAQWALIAPLQEEFFAGAGARTLNRTAFAVGDPKQSIYSFQGADPGRFLAESQALSARAVAAGRDFVAPSLATSFRSTPEVLACVDAVFAAQDLGGAPPDLFDRVAHRAARDGQQGLVEWWPLAPHPDAPDPTPWRAPRDRIRVDSAVAAMARALAGRVVEWIDAREAVWTRDGRQRPMRPGDVMALVRTRGARFEQILKAFKAAGLPVAGADRLTLKDDLAVQDLLALAKVALDPSDDLSLACALKGPFIGLIDDDRDLFPLAFDRAPGERLIDRLRRAPEPRFRTAADLIDRAIAARGAAPYAFFAAILDRVDAVGQSGWARLFARLGPEARDPAEELLARALQAPAAGQPSLQAFVGALEADASELKRQLDDDGAAVRVLTVHGAKGLEAPVVLLPDTADAPPGRPRDGLFLDEGGLLWSPSAGADDAAAAAIAARAKDRALGEHLRLLYVALTRARDRLIVCGAQKGKGEADPASWHSLVGRAMAGLGAPTATPFGEGRRLGVVLSAAEAPAGAGQAALPAWIGATAPIERAASGLRPSAGKGGPGRFAAAPARKAAIARGDAIHGLLERLPDLPDAAREAVGARWLARQGLPADMARDALAEALAVMREPAFAAAFGPDSRAEAAIVGMVHGRRVFGYVDRLRIADGETLVIDYKTDRIPPAAAEQAPAAYLAQLALYRAVLAAAAPARPVRCGLLFTAVPRLLAVPEALLDAAFAEIR